MAGFSGGRKLICPGLAALDTVRVWAWAQTSWNTQREETAAFDDNPVTKRAQPSLGMRTATFIVKRGDRRPAADSPRGGGRHGKPPFLEGVAFARQPVFATLPEPVDIVVTTSAGYPLDTTFYHNRSRVWLRRCDRSSRRHDHSGGGAQRRHWQPPSSSGCSTRPTLDGFMSGSWGRKRGTPRIFVMDQWQLEEWPRCGASAKVKVVSDGLPPEDVTAAVRRAGRERDEPPVADAWPSHGPAATIRRNSQRPLRAVS